MKQGLDVDLGLTNYMAEEIVQWSIELRNIRQIQRLDLKYRMPKEGTR